MLASSQPAPWGASTMIAHVDACNMGYSEQSQGTCTSGDSALVHNLHFAGVQGFRYHTADRSQTPADVYLRLCKALLPTRK